MGFAVGHLFYGPLSDRYGRRPVLLGGLLFFTATTFGCSFANSINDLIVLRVLQGLGAASGSVLGRALTRDAYTFQEMPLVMSWISLGQNIAPSLAPTIGGFLGEWASWRATFWFVGGFGTILFLVTLLGLGRPASIAANVPRQSPARLGRDAARSPLPRPHTAARLRLRAELRNAGGCALHPAGKPGLFAQGVRPDRTALGRRIHGGHVRQQPAGRPHCPDDHHPVLGLVPHCGIDLMAVSHCRKSSPGGPSSVHCAGFGWHDGGAPMLAPSAYPRWPARHRRWQASPRA
jgi:multidrug resistance protein